MPVATAMVLLLQVVAACISTAVMVHTHGSGMAMLQPVKNMTAVHVGIMCAGMAKKCLQLLPCYSNGTHEVAWLGNASKGDTMQVHHGSTQAAVAK